MRLRTRSERTAATPSGVMTLTVLNGPKNLPQGLENMESGSRIAAVADNSGGIDAARAAANASARLGPGEGGSALDAPGTDRPESWPQGIENVESAPGTDWPPKAPALAGAAVAGPIVRSPMGERRLNPNALLNGVAAC